MERREEWLLLATIQPRADSFPLRFKFLNLTSVNGAPPEADSYLSRLS